MKIKKGMTLLEVIISLAVFSILFVGGSLIIKTIVEQNVMSAQRQQARAIAQDIIEELKASKGENVKDDKTGESISISDSLKISDTVDFIRNFNNNYIALATVTKTEVIQDNKDSTPSLYDVEVHIYKDYKNEYDKPIEELKKDNKLIEILKATFTK